MRLRRDALGEIERVDDAVFALQAQQPRHKHSAQCTSAKQGQQLLKPDVDASVCVMCQCVKNIFRRDSCSLLPVPYVDS